MHPKVLKSYRITAHGRPLSPTETPLPQPKGREVLIRVSACGICHTDLHLWDGFYDLGNGERLEMADRGINPPITLGHEIVGEVEAAGPEASVATGQRRIVFPWIGCDDCPTCASGDGHLCLSARTLGIFRPGGYADHVLVPDEKYLFDFEGIPENIAATLACSGITVYSALRKLGMPSGVGRPVFIGAGGLGLTAIQLARAMGFQPPVVLDIDSSKLEHASGLAEISAVNALSAQVIEEVRELTKGGAIAVLDFVGSEKSARLGIDVLRRGGRLVIVGLLGGRISLPAPTVVLRAISIIGSYVGSIREFGELITLMKSGKVQAIPTTERNLGEVNEALMDLKKGKVVGRVVLCP